MSLVDDFEDEMAQTVTIHPYLSNDGWGDKYGTGVSHLCAVCRKQVEIKQEGGDIHISSMQIHLDGSIQVDARDKVEFGGKILEVLDVGEEYGIEDPSEIYARVIYT
jgi:hypothetical protein